MPLTPDKPSAKPGRGHRRRAIITAVAALVIASGAISTAAAPGAPSADPLVGELAPRPGDLALEEPTGGELSGNQTVTLVTGQQVSVGSGPDGRVTASPYGTSGPSELQITGIEKPGEPLVLSTVPPSATMLVAEGAIDEDLFDLNVLASRGFGDTSTPVTVHFEEVSTASQSEQKAAVLPGATYVPGSATAEQATVSVAAGSSETFWDSVTTPVPLDPDDPQDQPWQHTPDSAPRELAEGVAGLTLDGAPLATAPAPASTVPNHQLTVRIHASEDPSRWTWSAGAGGPFNMGVSCGGKCWDLIGVTGPSTAATLNPSAVHCEGKDPVCQTVVLTFTVPSGVYYLKANASDTRDTTTVTTFFTEPEVAIFDDRTVDLFMDDGIWMDPHTPQPSDFAGYGITMRRSLPDGEVVYDLAMQNGEWVPGYYLVPTSQQAVTGAFNVQLMHEWREPYITLTTNRGLDLRANYHPQDPYSSESPIRPELNLRNTRVRILDAGTGTAQDFAGIDAIDNLVVIGLSPEKKYGEACQLDREVIDRAAAAGAAAIVFDPRSDIYPTGACSVFEGHLDPYPVHPIIMIQPEEARQLREQISSPRPVFVNVDSPGHAGVGYIYELSDHFSGGIPQTIDQTITAKSLATRTTTLRGSTGSTADLGVHAWRPGFNLSGNWGVRLLPTESSRTLTEYLEVSRDAILERSWSLTNAANSEVGREKALEFVTQSDKRTEAFFAQPESVGPAIAPPDPGTWAGMWTMCSFCRSGDRLTPFSAINHPEPTHQTTGGLLPSPVLTDADGQEIPQTLDESGLPVYQLPPTEQRYTFVSTMPGDNHFEWLFTSGRVSSDNLPPGASCVQKYLDPDATCGAPQPLIYLRYNAPLDADNRAEAGSRHTVTITPYHQAPGAPDITQLATKVSFDAGKTWTPAKMRQDGDGSWSATFKVPALPDTDGYVTLRTTASDMADNSTDQLRTHAYELK